MVDKKTDINAQKRTGVEIIYEFKDSINSLLHYYALYINILAEIKTKAENKSEATTNLEKLDENQKQVILNYCNELRYHSTICYTKYIALYPSLKLKLEEKIKASYGKVRDNFLIDDSDVLELIKELQRVLMEDIIQELLKSNKDLLQGIYGTPKDE